MTLGHFLTKEERNQLERVGYSEGQDRSGCFLAADNSVLEINRFNKEVEVLPLSLAVEQDERVRKLIFGLIDPQKDMYVRMVKEWQPSFGYFIRVREGQEVTLPLQTCFYIRTDQTSQLVHNIVVAEPGATLHLISGCTTRAQIEAGRHVGVTEYYIGRHAKVTSTMIHNWSPRVSVYPRSVAQIGQAGQFISNYVAISPVKHLQMDPVAIVGPGGLAEFYSIIYAPEDSNIDIGSTIRLEGEGGKADIVSRVVSNGGDVITRGCIVGDADGVKGSMACNGLLVNSRGSIHAIPELIGNSPFVTLSHEASVGMISQDELSYLMAAGLSEDCARELIIQGFLDVRIAGLPKSLTKMIAETIRKAKLGEAV